MLVSKTPDIIIGLKYYSVSISILFSLAYDTKHSYPFMIFLGPWRYLSLNTRKKTYGFSEVFELNMNLTT